MKMEIKYHKMPADRSSVAGFTLMEVLVTIVILSIGLLGIAGLQLNSLRGNQSALDSTVAVSLAVEMADRIRANPPRNPNTGDLLMTSNYLFLDAAGSDPGCINTLCNTNQVELTDAYEWFTKLEELLPGAEGVICRDSTPNDGTGGSTTSPWNPQCDGLSDVFAVKVAWDHDRDPDTDFMVYRTSLIP
jgi:type IV pilus assembly protein PilV